MTQHDGVDYYDDGNDDDGDDDSDVQNYSHYGPLTLANKWMAQA